jgi:hypothetical protein
LTGIKLARRPWEHRCDSSAFYTRLRKEVTLKKSEQSKLGGGSMGFFIRALLLGVLALAAAAAPDVA